MKTFILGLCLCLAFTQARSAAPKADEPAGIKFFTGSWKDVLAEAKRQNKPVFVDIYTTWCGPCKLMAKQAFPDAKIGEKFNANFISYQIDAEKGEGVQVAKKYAVNAYPTTLYVSADGDLLHRAIGYSGIKEMLNEADKAIESFKDPNPLSAMERQYAGGKRDPEFLARYLMKRANVGMPNSAALDAYLKIVPEADWSTEKNINLIAGNVGTYNAKILDLLLQKLNQIKDATDEPTIALRNKIGEGVSELNQKLFDQAIASKNEQLLEKVITTNEAYLAAARGKLSATQANDMATGYRTSFYLRTKNLEKYRALASAQASKLVSLTPADIDKLNQEAYQSFEEETRTLPDSVKQSDNFKQYATSMKQSEPRQTAMKLNNFAWGYYENLTAPKDLTQALAWSAKSLEYDRSAMHLDTYAHLLSKLGRKAEAIKAQQEAIAKTKAAGEDPADYEKGLAEIKKK